MHPVQALREKSTDTEGGTELQVALRDTLKLWPTNERVTYRYGLFTRQYIASALRRGAGVLYGGDYEKLPLHYRRWTNNDVFNHAAASLTLDIKPNGVERTFWYDPLGGGPQRAPYDGEWITLDAVLDFNWSYNGRYYVGIVENLGDVPVKYLHLGLEQEPDKVVYLERGATARVSPRTTADQRRRFWNETKARPFLARFSGGWLLVLWDDGEGNTWDFGYVHRDEALRIETVEPGGEGGEGCDALRAALEQAEGQLDAGLIAATNTVEVLSK